MPISPDDIGQFFSGYAGAFNRALEDNAHLLPVADHFAAFVIESHAGGMICAANNSAFIKVLAQGYDTYRSIGTQRMSVNGVDSYPICDDHSVATVHWRADYVTKEKREIAIDFDVHYFVKSESQKLKIFGFIAGDEQGALRKAGVI